jgi:NAD(P)-dependent dehydrogenase (short-subunit alcohol dehydrogenase family)
MSNVNVVIGAGSIGQAIARRVSAGKRVLLADLWEENAKAAAEVLSNAGFEVSTATIDVSSRASVHKLVEAATALGDVTGVIHAAGVSPSQASPATILRHRGRSRGARERHGSRRRSPGIIITPLANDELTGPRGEGYRRMIELCPAGRAGTPDEVGTVGALLMGPDGGFITGSDFLMDGGVTASYWYGELAPK